MPARQSAEFDHRGSNGCHAHRIAWCAHLQRLAVARDDHDEVGVLHDALKAMLGQHHGYPEVVHEAVKRCQHFFSRTRVESRCGLVEHEHLGVRRQCRTNGYSLTLSTRERSQWRRAHVSQAKEVQSFFDASTHHLGGEAEAFHAVGEFVFNGVGDKATHRILWDNTDEVGEITRCMG